MNPITTAADAIAAETAARAAAVMGRAAEEVEAGLKNERERIESAQTNLDYYMGLGEQYLTPRPAEDPEDFLERPKRCSLLLQRVVDVLCQHLYCPGPARDFSALPAEVTDWLTGAYAGADVDATLAAADRHATLNDVALIQVCATGDPARPIRLHLWDSSQFALWTDPQDCSRPMVVATVDRVDQQTRYRLYSAEEIRSFETKKLLPGQTSGGRVATETTEGGGVNPEGILPFVVIPYRHASAIWDSVGPGESIRKANAAIDTSLSDLAQAIAAHLFPVGVACNVDPNWTPVLRPGGFVTIPADHTVADGAQAQQSSLSYIQAQVAVDQVWADVSSFVDHTLECAGVPRSAVRLEQSGATSGRAIVAEQAPLVDRAKQRRPLAAKWETDLARVVLAVGAYSTGRADLAAASRDPRLALTWPEVSSPIPDPADDARDQDEIDLGIASPITVLMRRRQITRAQALQLLQQVAEDRKAMAELGLQPILAAPNQSTSPSEN